MKKFLLCLAAAASLASNANAMYVIGDLCGRWDTGTGFEMEEIDNGWQWKGYIGDRKFFGFATELKPGMDWVTFNNNYRLSPENFSFPEDGEYSLHFGNPEAAFGGLGKEYTLTLTKDDNDAYSVKIETTEPSEFSWSMVGEYNSWNDDRMMDNINYNVWSTYFRIFVGSFKFRANEDWTVQYGAESKYIIRESGQYPVVKDGEPITIDGSLDLAVILDLNTNTLTTKRNSGYATPLAFRGEMTKWKWDGLYCLTTNPETGIYSVTLPYIEAGSRFKIANLDWNVVYSAQNLKMRIGETYELETLNAWEDMAFEESYDGEVILRIDPYHETICAIPSTNAVNTISVSDGNVTYYNLQGTKVDEPKNGVFIRVADGKSEKILVK